MSFSLQRVCVIGGAGHAGLPLALILADRGMQVDVLDANAKACEQINSGTMPFFEHAAETLLRKVHAAGRLTASTHPAVIKPADVVICSIGTPVDNHLQPEAHQFLDALMGYQPYFKKGQTLILRSTLFPGLTSRANQLLEDQGTGVHVAFCPERAAQGRLLLENCELPQIIGACDETGEATAREVFGLFVKEIITLTPLEAELAKLFSNAYRYVSFAIANEFYTICRDAGADYHKIHHATVHNNPRAAGLPRAGFAAGPCLRKDTLQLAAFAENHFPLGREAMTVNESLPDYVVRALGHRLNLRHATVGILGITFKADCDDPRESLAIKIYKLLRARAKRVMLHDPYLHGADHYPLAQVVSEADAIIIGTPHREYRTLQLSPEKVVEDVWSCLPATPT